MNGAESKVLQAADRTLLSFQAMAIFQYSLNRQVPEECRGGVLTLGNFDGVHQGHQALLRETALQARELGIRAIAVTFDPHPWQILRPNLFPPLITTVEDRAQIMLKSGADHVLILRTSQEMLDLDAQEFFDRILLHDLEVRALVEGFNFGFGRNREGTTDRLRQFCREANRPLTLVNPKVVQGDTVSSSRVRRELLAGRVALAKELLGRPYCLKGTVVVGQRRGAQLGFPTANLEQVQTVLPGNGVYAGEAEGEMGRFRAAINIGPNPTFGESARKIEVHLLDYQGDLYGKRLTVTFHTKLRETRPFASVEELIQQIRSDVADVKRGTEG